MSRSANKPHTARSDTSGDITVKSDLEAEPALLEGLFILQTFVYSSKTSTVNAQVNSANRFWLKNVFSYAVIILNFFGIYAPIRTRQ